MGRVSLPYTARGHDALLRELTARIPQLTDRWTDFNPTDPGMVLLELFCAVADMLFYYLDAQTAEAFLPTARQRQNVINLCKLIGYRLDGPLAATTELRFSVPFALDEDFTVPAGTVCRARLETGDVWFETSEDAFIARGQVAATASARQGRRKQETFTIPSSLRLNSKNIADTSVHLSVEGIPWTEVPDFQESTPDSLHFRLTTDADGVTTILFGDAVSGRSPGAGTVVATDYLETLGAAGNIGAGFVTDLVTPLYNSAQHVALSVTNQRPATGGADPETLDHARKQAPAELRALWKAVTKADYLALAEGYPGIAKAQVLDTNDCANIRYYSVNIAIAPNGGGLPSAQLKRELAEFIESRKVVTVEVNLYDPTYKAISIDAEIFAYTGEDIEIVRARAETALQDFFAFDRVGFGQAVRTSDLVALLDGVRGVSYIHLFTPAADLTLRPGEIPRLGEMRLDVRRADA